MTPEKLPTPEELLELANTPDRLTEPGKPEKAIVLPDGLLLLGACEDAGDNHHTEDLYIQILDNGLKLFWRDPEGLAPENAMWGRDWTEGNLYPDFEGVRAFAYTL